MIRHLFTLIWNRKRANFLLITEIFFAFVVLFVVGSMLVYNQQNYMAPLGYEYEQVWQLDLDPGQQPTKDQPPVYDQIVRRLKALPGVKYVARSRWNTPFSFSNNNGELQFNKGPKVFSNNYDVGPEMRDVLGLKMLQGRWFNKADETTTRPVTVITQEARDKLFPNENPIGKIIHSGSNSKYEWQVIGVTGTYRADSDFGEPVAGVFRLVTPLDTNMVGTSPMLIRVAPGSTAELEKRIITEVLNTAKGWRADVTTLPEQRVTKLKFVMTPIVGSLIVCAFLILNVALGLFGVLWYNINQRRAEIGLRRAIGASSPAISAQFLGEVMVVTTFGLLLGLVVAAQFPLLGVMDLGAKVYVPGMLLATVLIYILTAICALYPSRLASGIRPAVALREE